VNGPVAVAISAALTVVIAISSWFVARRAVLRLPVDFLNAERTAQSWRRRAVRTVLGLGLIGIGVALLVLPGPGIILILIGLVTCEIPGRRRILRRVLGGKRVLGELNAARERHGQPPLEPPARSSLPPHELR
jgi:hypothetical protein